jgi:hypothetical protein
MHARPAESAFSIRADSDWKHGSGWLFVFALRWMGRRRRLSTPDSLALVFAPESSPAVEISGPEAVGLVLQASDSVNPGVGPSADLLAEARAFAQRRLKNCAANRDVHARSAAGLSLLSTVKIVVDRIHA